MELTAGQGSALSGFFTAIGAVIAILLGSVIFRNKVSDLKSAIQETERSVEAFRTGINEKLNEIGESFEILNELMSGLQKSSANTQSAIHELQATEDDPPEVIPNVEMEPDDQLREEWHRLLGRIESIASSPNVDGRTRAKYARIDRRSYYDLIDALDADERLAGLADTARDAVALWYSCRRRVEIDRARSEKMREYAQLVSAIPIP